MAAVRDRKQTSKRILKALGEVISKHGFTKVGINAVAKAAGVDKVLIYRYFGGLPELLKEYAQSTDFWPGLEDLLDCPADETRKLGLFELGKRAFLGHLRELRKRPLTQELMRWELLERNQLTDTLAEARERQGMELIASHPDLAGTNTQVLGMIALVHAGLTYLVLRSKTADVYLGIDLSSEEGWKQIEQATESLTHALLAGMKASTKDQPSSEPPVEQAAE